MSPNVGGIIANVTKMDTWKEKIYVPTKLAHFLHLKSLIKLKLPSSPYIHILVWTRIRAPKSFEEKSGDAI